MKEEITNAFPALELSVLPKGSRINGKTRLVREAAVVCGALPVDPTGEHTSVAYRVAVLFPKNFPGRVPLLFYDDPAVPFIADRHVFSSGQACLCAPADYGRYWQRGSSFTQFMHELVQAHLVGQYHYGAYGKWPHAYRSHGSKGLWEAYAERLGTTDRSVIEGFLLALSDPNPRLATRVCPCGNGAQLRDCHANVYAQLCADTTPQQVALELAVLSPELVPASRIRALQHFRQSHALAYGLASL